MQMPVRSSNRLVAALLAIIWVLAGTVGFIVTVRSGQWWWALLGVCAFWYALVWVRVVVKARLLTWQEATMPWRGSDPGIGKSTRQAPRKRRKA
ncbi:MAG: hypothetical protein ABIQ36_03065 [Rhodanobacter sp.]